MHVMSCGRVVFFLVSCIISPCFSWFPSLFTAFGIRIYTLTHKLSQYVMCVFISVCCGLIYVEVQLGHTDGSGNCISCS